MIDNGTSVTTAALDRADPVPLVLDLDGTLIRTESLIEQALAFVRRNPFAIFRLVGWVLAGRVTLKERLAAAVPLNPELLPINEEVVTLAQQEADKGRKVVLATAAHAETAKLFLEKFPFISEVLATEANVNLKGKTKAEALVKRFPEGFDYAGDSRADLEVWKRARNAILVDRKSTRLNSSHV